MSYDVQLTASAVRDLDRLPPRYVAVIAAFLYGPLAGNPRSVGKPLRDDLAGLHSARRGQYRVLYEILDDATVLVHRIAHRAHVYRRP